MNTLKLRAFVRPYIPSIDKALIKHGYSTDIALFTQLLRKKIEQGEMCYQCALTMLKKYLSSIVLVLLQYCLGTDLVFISNTIFGLASGFFPVGSVPWSYHGMDSFGYCSALLREVAEGHPKRSRSRAEAHPNVSRSCPDAEPKKSRSAAEDKPKPTRRGVEISPSSDFALTNFAPISAFYSTGSGFSSGFHRVTPIETRCRPDENPMKGRNSVGIAQKMVDYSLAQETHKLDYSATLGSPLLSPCYTQGRLNDCTRPTQQKQAFQQVGESRLTYGVESKRSVLSLFKLFCDVKMFAVSTLLGSISRIAQRALKCFSIVAGYHHGYRMRLTCFFLMMVFQSSNYSFKVLKSIRALALLALMVSMFSLSAQTPRKDSGADGLSEIRALIIGDTIPEKLWNLKMPVYNDSKGRSSISLSDYSDNKLIIVDFWATWCTNCLESFPKLDRLKTTFKNDFDVLLVNSKRTHDDQARIDKVLKKYKDSYQLNVQFPYLIGDSVFNALFPHRGIPHVVWIGNDRVVKAITYTTELQEANIRQILDGHKANFYIKDDFKYKVEDSASMDTLKLFSSYLSKRREGIREMGVQIKERGNEKEFTFLNSTITMRIYEQLSESGHRIDRNLWVFDNNVGKEVRRKLKTPQRYVDEYCYFLRYPKDQTGFDPYRKMIHDIQDNFGVGWEIRKAVIDVWRIDSTPKVRQFKTKGYMPLEAIDELNNRKFIQNLPLRNSFHVLSWLLNKPVVLGDIEKINVDFDLPADLLDYTDEQLLQLLEQLGAKITVVPQEVEHVYFSADRGI